MKDHFIYVVVSHTATRFGKILRIFGKIEYNHSAIALDENFNELYAFARPQYRAMILARLVKENNGLWSGDAEKYLLANAKPLE